jgi:hypothetical protein
VFLQRQNPRSNELRLALVRGAMEHRDVWGFKGWVWLLLRNWGILGTTGMRVGRRPQVGWNAGGGRC